MIIELHHNDGQVEPQEIARTELNAPLVIKDGDKFFIKAPHEPRICLPTTKQIHLCYRQCRGENLNNIAIMRSVKSEEILP